MEEEIILQGEKLNILGRDLIKLNLDYDIKIFENFNIFVSTNEDLSENIEYRNCCIHFIYLNLITKFLWKYNATDTLILNFINLKNTYYADNILLTMLNLSRNKEDFNFIDNRIIADFLDFNLLNREIKDKNKKNVFFGSELFVPNKIIFDNNNNKKLKVDLYSFSNNYLSAGANIVTKINDVRLLHPKNKKIKTLNEDLIVEQIEFEN